MRVRARVRVGVPCDWPVGVAVSAGEEKVALERHAKGPPSASAHVGE